MAQQTRAAVVAAALFPTLGMGGTGVRVRASTMTAYPWLSSGIPAWYYISTKRGIVLEVLINTARLIYIFMRSSSTGAGLGGEAGSMVITASKNGGAGAVITPAIVDLSSSLGAGWYTLAMTAGQLNTLGEMALHVVSSNTIPNDDVLLNVIAVDKTDAVRFGLSALPNAAAGAAGGLSQAVIRGGTAQGAGAGSNQIQLDAGASSTDNLFNRHRITIVSGTGAGQTRFIISYVGSSKTATVGRNWTIAPDATSVFEITQDTYNLLTEGLAQAGAASSITFKASDTASTDVYKGTWLHVVSGTGAGQSRLITGYNSSTKIATVDTAWITQPDSTSGYQVLEGANTFSVNQTVAANVTEWLGAAPASLSSNGYVQAMLMRWLTDNGAGTPDALVTNLVPAIVDGTIVVSNVNVVEWLGATPAALDGSGNVPANVMAVGNAAAVAAAVLDAARSGHITLGTVGEGIALATSLLQGNFFIDNVTPSANGPTAQRIRCWLSASAMAGVTPGGTGQGEFATFLVTTTYSGPGVVVTHKVIQQ